MVALLRPGLELAFPLQWVPAPILALGLGLAFLLGLSPQPVQEGQRAQQVQQVRVHQLPLEAQLRHPYLVDLSLPARLPDLPGQADLSLLSLQIASVRRAM